MEHNGQRIGSGPDRFDFFAGFASVQKMTFGVGGARLIPVEVIVEGINLREKSKTVFSMRGNFVADEKEFSGYYNTTTGTGQFE